ncbi:MAG TPA: hypothetical protein PKW33_05975 [Anaerolineaceae bacterium]|nr:hypothetical protein [Anaerolineaceae bacterium]HPN51115.1 hypothetical protein [Anaerolineaceae bacterium]
MLLRRTAHPNRQPTIHPSLTDGLELDHQAYLLGNLDASQQRQWLFDSAIQNHNPALASLEQEIGRELIEIQSNSLSSLSEQENSSLSILHAQNAQLRAVVEQQSARLSELQSNWRQETSQIEAQVGEIIQSARTIAVFISETYPNTSLNEIFSLMDMAEEGLTRGAGQAALVWAQQALSQALALRTQLEINAIEYAQWLGVALYQLDLLHSTLISNQQVYAIDAEGRELDTWIDVDPWVNGRLSQLERAVSALRSRLQSTSCSVSLPEIRHLLEKYIPEMNLRLRRLLEEARQAVIAAQMRVNIADLIVTSLTRQGYGIRSAGFSQADMRCQYDLTLENPDGGVVQVHVIPQSSKSPRHELILDARNDSVQSEYELRRRTQEILSSLHQFGISVQNNAEVNTTSFQEEAPSLQLPVFLPCPSTVSL